MVDKEQNANAEGVGPNDLGRRSVLKLTGLGAMSWILGSVPFSMAGCASQSVRESGKMLAPVRGGLGLRVRGWQDYQMILARIHAPTFPNRDFSIMAYGAAEGADVTDAIAKAVAACHEAGGGRVVVPAGAFLCGPIVLKSNVNLYLSEGCILKFSTDPARYPMALTRWEGIECMNYAALISAFEQENVAITGKGILDGQANNGNWWAWKARQIPDQKQLIQMGEQGIPVSQRVFGQGHLLRPNFVQIHRCRNVLIEGVSIKDSPMWELHPVLSSNVTVRGVQIHSHGPNNDGCDPESCYDVLIEDCVFDTGDDCIAIKSGKNNDGRRVGVPSENIVIRNCHMMDGHGGVVLGSECSGNIRNVFVEDCNMDSPHLDRMLRFKDNAVRGGILENVFVRNVRVGRVGEAIVTIDFLYEEGANGPYKPVVRNVQIERVSSTASPRVMYVVAFDGAVIDGIRFVDCTFKGVEATEVLATSGSVEFRNTVIEPRDKPASLSTRLPL
jgi:polygalacturonase